MNENGSAAAVADANEGQEDAAGGGAIPQVPPLHIGLQNIGLKVVNVTGKFQVDVRIDIKAFARSTRNAEVKRQGKRNIHWAVFVRLAPTLKATAIIFGNGKILVTGCRTEESYCQAVNKLMSAIRRLYNHARLKSSSITNLIVAGNIGFPIHVARVRELLAEGIEDDDIAGNGCRIVHNVNFEAGLLFRYKGKVAFSVFHNGYFNVHGCVNKKQVREAVEALYVTVLHYRVEEGEEE